MSASKVGSFSARRSVMTVEKRGRYRCPKCGKLYTSSFPFEHMYCLPNEVHSVAVRMARIVTTTRNGRRGR